MQNIARIAELASKQHGTVSRAQILALGETERAVEWALARGALHRLHQGVYLLAGARQSREARLWAALHHAGDGAVLSHQSAGWHWRLEGLGRAPPHVIDVSVPVERRARSSKSLRVHRTRSLVLAKDYATLAGIPVTSISRTLIDLCEVLSEKDLEHAFDSVVRRDEQNRNAVIEALFRLRVGRPHLDTLATIANRKEYGCTQSWLENEVRQVLRAANIGLPLPQFEIKDHHRRRIGLFDFAWPERDVVLMVDSWEFHKSREIFEKDRRQSEELQALGWRPVPVTYRRLTFEREAFLTNLRAILGLPAVIHPP